MHLSHVLAAIYVASTIYCGTQAATLQFSKRKDLIKAASKRTVTYRSILRNHNASVEADTPKLFSYDTLAYVTPWNSAGYEYAEEFASKWSYVSPVWLQIRVRSASDIQAKGTTTVGQELYISGIQDIDDEWMQRVRRHCTDNSSMPCPRIVPRVIFEAPQVTPEMLKRLQAQLLSLCSERSFDGFAFEPFGGMESLEWIAQIADSLHQIKNVRTPHVILILPPGQISKEGHLMPPVPTDTLERLANHIDRFQIMTYDFSSSYGVIGPNAPIGWMRMVMENIVGQQPSLQLLRKLMLGIPLYGRDGSDAVTGNDIIQRLRETKPRIDLEEGAQEHYIRYQIRNKNSDKFDTRIIYFPTLYSTSKRIALAEELGVGVAFWELGQGMPYFYGLL